MRAKFIVTAILSGFTALACKTNGFPHWFIFFSVLGLICLACFISVVVIERKAPELPLEDEFKNLEVDQDGQLLSDNKKINL